MHFQIERKEILKYYHVACQKMNALRLLLQLPQRFFRACNFDNNGEKMESVAKILI